ncbi:MAG TPA: hypothetical protein VIF62_12720 [Labilithrix sp.]
MRLAALLVLAAAACRATAGADVADADAPAPTFSTEPPDGSIGARAGRLLLASCSGGPESSCHAMGAGEMTIPGSDLVDVPSSERPDMVRVKPFDPARSYLWLKVLGDGGIDGARMPKDQDPLDPDAAATLLSWIAAGAP